MPASAATKSVAAKGKKAATPAQVRAAAREELNALFASAPEGSIAGEEEYLDFAKRVLAQLDIIGGGEATEEVVYQAARLVRDTIGFATGVEGEEVDANVPWTHPLYRQAFAQVQAELAAERAEREEAEEPASAAEVEAEVAQVDELADDDTEVVDTTAPKPRTRSQRKVAPRPVRVPQPKPAVKVVSTSKRALPADDSAVAPTPRKRARAEALAFPAPVWRPASGAPSSSIRCAYCASHPGGAPAYSARVLPSAIAACWADKVVGRPAVGRRCLATGMTRRATFASCLLAVRLDGVLAAKVIRSRGRSSDMPAWVKEAWDAHRSARQALHATGEGSLGDSSASEVSPPRSGRSAKTAAPSTTHKSSLPGSGSGARLSHVEVRLLSLRTACFARC
ncbi:hypothetical protein NUW54_g8452 [Trametes sanguinea]|uniref:Uncharacterized protein n=1 Tax=Trametes sanguinea TaxID=158606 RepID=A0ACC1PEJ1_9APHY|nr:hypothetical protein NUW54_g8452 [Trametes sanguinea]